MTTTEPDRLDRIERILEGLTTLHQRTDQHIAAMTEQQQTAAEQIDRQLDALAANQIEERDRRLEFRDELEALFQSIQQTDRNVAQLGERVNQLTTNVDRLTADVGELRSGIGEMATQMELQFEQTEQDRSQAAIDRAEFRSTVEQLLQVLRQSFNGNGRGGE